MNEFSSRVESQRRILKIVNGRTWKKEQLFALSTQAIQRWTSKNFINDSSQLVKLLYSASAHIFVMANHSDDPIAGIYALTQECLDAIERQVKEELDGKLSPASQSAS